MSPVKYEQIITEHVRGKGNATKKRVIKGLIAENDHAVFRFSNPRKPFCLQVFGDGTYSEVTQDRNGREARADLIIPSNQEIIYERDDTRVTLEYIPEVIRSNLEKLTGDSFFTNK